MDWGRYAQTVVAAGAVTALTDWLFMGVLFHDKYNAYPEVWRRPKGGAAAGGVSETGAIAWSSALGVASCAVFVFVCARLGLTDFNHALRLAAAVWVIAAAPILVTNALWVKLHPLITLASMLGWLVRLGVCALAVGWLMR